MVRARKNPVPDGRVNNGGARQGTPGQAYVQRSDLRAQKVQTAPGQGYGAAAAQAAAQKIVPMAAAPAPPAPAAPAPAGQSAFGGDMGHIVMPDNYLQPGEVTPLHAPTQRPGEPLTHGLPVGPGAGPEVLGAMAPVDTLGPLLQQVAATQGASPDVKALAQWVSGGPR